MASITTWTRLEPRSRTADVEVGLAARVHDPLWFLARQWQLGELQGQDAGTPIEAELRAAVGRIDRYHPGPPGAGAATASVAVDDAAMPLEAVVEREALDARSAPRLAAESGAHFLRMLVAAGFGGHREAFTARYARPTDREEVQGDPAGALFVQAVAGRVPDGFAMRADLRQALGDDGTGTLPPALGLGQDEAAVRVVVGRWLEWLGSLAAEPPPGAASWDPPRLEYRFAVGATVDGAEHTLVAEEYAGGHLDWDAFTRRPGPSLGSAAASEVVARDVIPTPAEYSGMPASRWWEFEDATVDFGAVDGSADDIARMLLLEFAVVFGNDWYVIPVDLPVGALCRVRSLVVTDTFGVRSLIRPASEADAAPWRMFSLTGAPDDLYFLPPALASLVEGPARERVGFARDELANLAWAIEEAVESATGVARLRDAESVGRTEPPGGVVEPGEEPFELRYRLRTEVPDYWYPLVPVARPGLPALELELRTLTRADGSGIQVPITPRGVLLNEVEAPTLFEAEIPREGVNVERAFQLTRWMGGRTVAWSGRRAHVGRGPTASGLRFDTSDPV